MRAITTVGSVLLVLALANVMPVLAQDVEAAHHNWSEIAYPALPAMSDGSPAPHLMVQNGKEEGLRLTLSFHVSNSDGEPRKDPLSPEKISVRLHSGDGKITDPEPEKLDRAVGLGNARGTTFSYSCRFPWRRNVLEEAWIEVHLAEQVYWVEVPYGFTRNPADPLTPDEARRGQPVVPRAMKLGKNDRLVPWLHVHYDLGRIQNDWQLSINMANPFDAEAEVLLYRDDSQVGKSMYLWELHSPHTGIQVKQPGGETLESRCMSIRLHEDGMRRSDLFKFNRNPRDSDRCWGTAVIKVDDKSYEYVVPSSLFQYAHGIAEPDSKSLVPRKSDR